MNKTRLPKVLKRVVVAYPSGNTTAVVYDQLLGSDRKALNELLMVTWRAWRPEQSEVEQCCFITTPRDQAAIARVEIFGGEFCGNAARSVAWLVTKGQDCSGLIEVSGVDRPLEFGVQNGEVKVEMPLPNTSELLQAVDEGVLVWLDGIAQLVATKLPGGQTPRQLLTSLLLANSYKLADQPAVGVSYYDQTSGKAEFCVWVRNVDTTFNETACGSGTCAIGVALASKARDSVRIGIVQPSGETITTEATYQQGGITKSSISGMVNVLYDGVFKLA